MNLEKSLETTLHLTLKKKWFDMIASGAKREENREMKPYWNKRLMCNKIELLRGNDESAVSLGQWSSLKGDLPPGTRSEVLGLD